MKASAEPEAIVDATTARERFERQRKKEGAATTDPDGRTGTSASTLKSCTRSRRSTSPPVAASCPFRSPEVQYAGNTDQTTLRIVHERDAGGALEGQPVEVPQLEGLPARESARLGREPWKTIIP